MTTAIALALLATGLQAQTPQKSAPRGVCVTVCSHWSYIGIGWQLGIESVALSAEDAMHIADMEPHVRACLEIDARAYEFLAQKFPETAAKLSRYLKAGKVELIGGTYAQPMGTTIGSESNIRQIVVGRKLIKKVLGYDMTTFLDEEEFSYPQLPQILAESGYKYASLAQVDTWGRTGIPNIELNSFNWKGTDGTTIPTTPKNAVFRVTADMSDTGNKEGFKKLRALGKPLIVWWDEFGWEPEEHPTWESYNSGFKEAAKHYPLEFVTLTQYMDRYGSKPKQTIYLPMEAFQKRLTWGLGGDQVRIFDRKLEGTLQSAETFDAFASTLGGTSQVATLDQAWRDMMTAESHDVALCEYSRWQGGPQPRPAKLDRVEDKHNQTWGSIGYQHMDAALAAGTRVLISSLKHIASRVRPTPVKADRTVSVFNPLAWNRTGLATTGRLYPLPAGTKDIAVIDKSGRRLPSQLAVAERDAKGNLIVANVAFTAENVPSVGYETYGLRFSKDSLPPVPTGLKVDEKALTIENAHMKLAFDADTGAVKSLIDKHSGKEMLRPGDGEFPILRGRPNDTYPLHNDIPKFLDSSTNKVAELQWMENGPVRATLRARHLWNYVYFETYISLTPESRAVEVISRLLTEVPPQPNSDPNEYTDGFWLTFAPAGECKDWIRDYPLGVEATKQSGFHALTFADRDTSNGGLLVLHDGTQWFQVDEKGFVKNLLVREWESEYSLEWGFPRYCEYRHALEPHDASMTNADRLRASSEFTRPLLTVVGAGGHGKLPLRHSFLTVSPAGAQVLAFRKKDGPGFEFRVVESEGRTGLLSASFGIPGLKATNTDLLGRPLAKAIVQRGGSWRFKLPAWRVLTFDLR